MLMATGSPSLPALMGILSISSISKTLMGRDARLAGELLPAMASLAPFLNVFKRMVLSPSLLFGSPISSFNAGVLEIIGAKREVDQSLAISSVGCSTKIGPGSW